MQQIDGKMEKIDVQKGDKLLSQFGEAAPIVRTGDKFAIRGCRFKVTKITPTGIEATGLGAIKPTLQAGQKFGRNEKCPCGSGKKVKHCCGR